MKRLASMAVASMLLASACSGAPQDTVADQTPVAGAAPAHTVHNYRCASGETVSATYYPSTDAATVAYKGNKHEMEVSVSGSGARFVGDDLEWWTKGSGAGSEGTLFRHLPDGTSGEIIETCTES